MQPPNCVVDVRQKEFVCATVSHAMRHETLEFNGCCVSISISKVIQPCWGGIHQALIYQALIYQALVYSGFGR